MTSAWSATFEAGVALQLPYPSVFSVGYSQTLDSELRAFQDLRGVILPSDLGALRGLWQVDLRVGLEWRGFLTGGLGYRDGSAELDLSGFEYDGTSILDSARVGGRSMHAFLGAFQRWFWGEKKQWAFTTGAGVSLPLWASARMSSTSPEGVREDIPSEALDRVFRLPLPEVLLLEFRYQWDLR